MNVVVSIKSDLFNFVPPFITVRKNRQKRGKRKNNRTNFRSKSIFLFFVTIPKVKYRRLETFEDFTEYQLFIHMTVSNTLIHLKLFMCRH